MTRQRVRGIARLGQIVAFESREFEVVGVAVEPGGDYAIEDLQTGEVEVNDLRDPRWTREAELADEAAS